MHSITNLTQSTVAPQGFDIFAAAVNHAPNPKTRTISLSLAISTLGISQRENIAMRLSQLNQQQKLQIKQVFYQANQSGLSPEQLGQWLYEVID